MIFSQTISRQLFTLYIYKKYVVVDFIVIARFFSCQNFETFLFIFETLSWKYFNMRKKKKTFRKKYISVLYEVRS